MRSPGRSWTPTGTGRTGTDSWSQLMRRPLVQGAVRRGDQLFCWERPAGAEQYLLTRRSAVDRDADPVTVLDPVGSTADATTAVDWFEPSPDGSLVAVGLSEGGTRELDVAAGLRPGRGARRLAGRRDRQHPGLQRGVGAGRVRVLLHPPSRGRPVPPQRSPPPVGDDSDADPVVWSDTREPAGLAVGRARRRRAMAAGDRQRRLESNRPSPAGPHHRQLADRRRRRGRHHLARLRRRQPLARRGDHAGRATRPGGAHPIGRRADSAGARRTGRPSSSSARTLSPTSASPLPAC